MQQTPFGRYQLLELLSQDGTGEVYRAHDSDTDRIVAVKVFAAQLTEDADFQHHFHCQLRVAAGLSDPHLVPIHNYGEIDGRLYVDARLIDGRNLAAVIADGPLHPARAVAVVEQIASAVDAAHHAGLTHYLTASDIQLAAGDFAYLTVVGTAADSAADPRPDVHALARLLDQCLTGYPSPDVPPAFAAVIARGLATNPDECYRSAAELAYAARAALAAPVLASGLPPQAPRVVSPPVRVARYLTMGLAAILGVYLLAVFVVARGGWQSRIDEHGGTRVTLTAQTPDGAPPAPDSLVEAQQVIGSRIEGLGIVGSRVAVDADKVVVTVPGDDASAISGIGQIGRLYIRPVLTAVPAQTQQQAIFPQPRGSRATRIALAKKLRQSDNKLIQVLALRMQAGQCDQADVLAGNDDPALPLVTCSTDHHTAYLLGPAIISGDQITDASSRLDQKIGGYLVELRFNGDATKTWAEFTASHIGTQTGFTLDSQVVSAPQILEAIPGGRVRIAGDFTPARARDLASVLNSRPLPLAFESSAPETIPPKPRSTAAALVRPPAAVLAGTIALLLVLCGALVYLYRPAKRPQLPANPAPSAGWQPGPPAAAVAPQRTGLAVAVTTIAVMVVAITAVAGYLVLRHPTGHPAAESTPAQAIRVASNTLITQPGGDTPKVVLSLYEDFLCPACGNFEQVFGPTVSRLIDTSAVAADYYPVAILNSPTSQKYSLRAAAAAYCVADQSIDAFQRFHATLFTPQVQPDEIGGSYPDNARLITLARQAGAAAGVADCINSEKYLAMVKDMAEATGIHATPTLRINGEDYRWSTPAALIAKIKEIVGPVPGL